MKPSNKTVLFLLVLGIGLFLISEVMYSPVDVNAAKLDKEHLGDRIVTHGTVSSVTRLDEVTFIELREKPEIKIVKFTDIGDVDEGDRVRIEGTVGLYEGDLEIKADTIETG
ncbi:MAG: OB-fold nucleic acid binding domain-containing protein [Candidatus Nanohaloarchaea archaeon]|nr:OB-fold nucleic acid binding domain-containing protein [Candidatus Nanohaloarchaea archaeon]